MAGTFLETAPDRAGRRADRRAGSTSSRARPRRRWSPHAGGAATAAGPGSGSTACSPPRAAAPSSPARSTDGAVHRRSATSSSSPARAEVRVRAIQTLGRRSTRSARATGSPSTSAAIDHARCDRGDAVVEPDRWRPTDRFDASLHVLAALDHEVSRRGAYLAYIGSGEHAVTVRVLGRDATAPRRRPVPCGCTSRRPCRCCPATASCCASRVATRRSAAARCSTSLRCCRRRRRARPDGRAGRRRAGLGRRRRARAAHGRARRADDRATGSSPRRRRAWPTRCGRALDAGRADRLDVAPLDDRERAVLATLDDITSSTVATAPGSTRADPLVDHPVVGALRRGWPRTAATRRDRAGELRELVRRGVVVERDGLWLHADAVDRGRRVAADLLARRTRTGSPSASSATPRDHPQARRAAAGRARRPGDHPPPEDLRIAGTASWSDRRELSAD